MDFGLERGCGGPYLAALHTSSRVQNCVEFVELARDMSSNCTGEVQARTGISGRYQLPARIIPGTTQAPCGHPVGKRMSERNTYVEVRDDHLHNTYAYECFNVVVFAT